MRACAEGTRGHDRLMPKGYAAARFVELSNRQYRTFCFLKTRDHLKERIARNAMAHLIDDEAVAKMGHPVHGSGTGLGRGLLCGAVLSCGVCHAGDAPFAVVADKIEEVCPAVIDLSVG